MASSSFLLDEGSAPPTPSYSAVTVADTHASVNSASTNRPDTRMQCQDRLAYPSFWLFVAATVLNAVSIVSLVKKAQSFDVSAGLACFIGIPALMGLALLVNEFDASAPLCFRWGYNNYHKRPFAGTQGQGLRYCLSKRLRFLSSRRVSGATLPLHLTAFIALLATGRSKLATLQVLALACQGCASIYMHARHQYVLDSG